MRATKENLKKEEDGFVTSFKDGAKQGFSMRGHLNNIRQFKLYHAEGFDNFDALQTKLSKIFQQALVSGVALSNFRAQRRVRHKSVALNLAAEQVAELEESVAEEDDVKEAKRLSLAKS